MKKLLLLTGAVTFLCSLGLQCSSDKAGLGDFCSKDGDCKSGLACVNNTCVEFTGDCEPPCNPDTQTCFSGECVTIVDPNDRDGDGSPATEDCNDSDREVHPQATEYCDGVDNNCDGATDENCPPCTDGEIRSCGSDLGECTPGTQSCTAGTWEPCGGTGPAPELCDGNDNDCNGLTDEVCPCEDGDDMPCGVDMGVCRRGIQNCEEGVWSTCIGGRLPLPEECDGLDNDCDGMTDNGFIWVCGCISHGDCAAAERCIQGRCQMQEFVCPTSGGGQVSSTSYYLEVFVAPPQPVGDSAGQSYDARLGPGAIRGAR